MSPRTMAVLLGILLSAMALPLAASPTRAADVNVTLIALNSAWHVGSDSSAATTITVTVGDTLRLRIENHESAPHTFTAPQFGVDDTNLSAMGSVTFWNHTVTSTDVGTWQYYCTIHSTGTYPNRAGMVGVLSFVNPTPPQPAGISPLVIAGLVLIVVAVVAVAVLMRRRKPAP